MGVGKNPWQDSETEAREIMQLKLLKIIENKIKTWLEQKPTGKLNVEIHARKGGISKVYKDEREEVVE
jgi:hypothetical protein